MNESDDRLLALQLLLLYISDPSCIVKRLNKAFADLRKQIPSTDKTVAELLAVLHLEKA